MSKPFSPRRIFGQNQIASRDHRRRKPWNNDVTNSGNSVYGRDEKRADWTYGEWKRSLADMANGY